MHAYKFEYIAYMHMSPNASVAKYCAFGEGVEKRILGFMQSRQFTQQRSYQTNSSSVTHARRAPPPTQAPTTQTNGLPVDDRNSSAYRVLVPPSQHRITAAVEARTILTVPAEA